MSLTEKYQLLVNQKIGINKFLDTFSNESECLELYFNLKFSTCNCIKCNRPVVLNYVRISRKTKNGIPKKAFRCRSCHTFIYPLSNTVFRRSKIPLSSIFYVIFSLCSGRSSMSATDIAQTIGISYKTAHRLMMLVRMLLYHTDTSKMEGAVEVDEAFIGTGNKVYNWSSICTRKKPIVGLVERGTKQARLFLVPNRNAFTMHKLIRKNIKEGSTIYTDSWRGYNGLSEYYNHEIVNHSEREFVRGDAHTNSIENLWGNFKRNIRRAHIKISDKYVNLYLNEACWRHNSKGIPPMQLFHQIITSSFFSPYCY